MKKLLLPLLLLSSIFTKGQHEYDVDKIPAALKVNAAVVIRMEKQVYDLKSIGNATYNYQTAVTILNKNGEDAASMVEYYNQFSNIYNLKATMYDGKGVKIKEYKSADFKDKSAISDGSIYEDGRMKQLDFLNASFPYTIEYSYTKDYTGITSYPSWYPVQSFGYAVEKSDYTFKIPEGMTFKYLKSKGLLTDSLKIKDKTTYKWSCENLEALEYEPYSTGLRNVRPWVNLSPNAFEYDHSQGNLENWKNVGTWMYQLNSEPQILPEAIKTKVAGLMQQASTPKQKINLLYKFLQANTRYVSVQLGIGGLKPTNANKVATVNYGDCKALSNYMKALLNEAGIAAHLVVIGYDMPSMNEKFASLNQANHMILAVPLQKDTVWLECTSQVNPMGYLAYGCSDKNVLLVTAEGGKIVRTPAYRPADNFQQRNINITLDEKGAAAINIDAKYGYAQYENMIYLTLKEPSEQRKSVLKELEIPNMELISASFIQADKNLPEINEKISAKSSQLFTHGADKVFITLNLLNRRESVPVKAAERKTNFTVPFGYHDVDEISYSLPANLKVEFLPKEVTIVSEFGNYNMKVEVQNNVIVYKRTQTMNNKQYPPEKYNELIEFYKKVYQADKLKGILAKVN
ncbi:DUF3857 domain-containing protein [Pedobacter sp.]|uniref:DUF3857 domain-containing protein n=1 Tax=Pedobacter sp. TaxID=1411316 RepID=UPI003D7FCB27